MMVRDVMQEDWERVQELFKAQGFDYELPGMGAFSAIKVVTEGGLPKMAILARPTVEIYMLADSSWATPGQRFKALQVLHEDMRQELSKMGIADAHTWLPPEIEKPFGRRLCRSFQWGKSRWQCYEREV